MYSNTENDGKIGTRNNRKLKNARVMHTDEPDVHLNYDTINPDIIKSNTKFKNYLGIYTSTNATNYTSLKEGETIVIDSEYNQDTCPCGLPRCACPKAFAPLMLTRDETIALENFSTKISQGETNAVSWVVDFLKTTHIPSTVVITSLSDDRDLIPMLLIACSLYNNEMVTIYLEMSLKKQKVYANINALCRYIGTAIKIPNACIVVGWSLMLGGNDNISSFYGKSHATVLKTVLQLYSEDIQIVNIDLDSTPTITCTRENIIEFTKKLYFPTIETQSMSFAQARYTTMKMTNRKLWIPPESYLNQHTIMVNCTVREALNMHNRGMEPVDYINEGALCYYEERPVINLGDEIYMNKAEILKLLEDPSNNFKPITRGTCDTSWAQSILKRLPSLKVKWNGQIERRNALKDISVLFNTEADSEIESYWESAER